MAIGNALSHHGDPGKSAPSLNDRQPEPVLASDASMHATAVMRHVPSSIQIQRRFNSTVARLHHRKCKRADTRTERLPFHCTPGGGVMRLIDSDDLLLGA